MTSCHYLDQLCLIKYFYYICDMNNLKHNDICYCETPEERIRIMELFKSHSKVHRYTWMERYDDGDYDNFPYLIWDMEDGLLAHNSNIDDCNLLSVDEFLSTGGFSQSPQGDSFIRHYFIHK